MFDFLFLFFFFFGGGEPSIVVQACNPKYSPESKARGDTSLRNERVGDGSAVKSWLCSCRAPELGSQN